MSITLHSHKHKRKQRRTHPTIQHQKHILASIIETLLTTKTQLQIPSYNIISKDRQTGWRGGVAILIKKNIDFTEIVYSLPLDNFTTTNHLSIYLFSPHSLLHASNSEKEVQLQCSNLGNVQNKHRRKIEGHHRHYYPRRTGPPRNFLSQHLI